MDEVYQYDCANPEFEELARVISDLFPEQTQFIQRAGEDGTPPNLAIHWVAMRFGAAARRIVMTVVIAPTALARYQALPARLRGRSFAVLRAYVEASIGSLEEQYANGEAVPRDVTVDLGDEFA
ncbi:hypothetical protein R69927_06069 [Paraburkholderia domus]|jgi:hypothetical protein|uniref:DUF3022 domain-containing protein n=1 Tax=Paraburkholderia domus TaxID=2793075 RepID=A0A9N8R1U6_9BURK|nr:DUF3022 domain-containing protein [Paraburkholderia domus]MBK5053256.1 DUF3022 domain-containing protein [Burkholderia sp. R-70006]MBK5065187.1 DUF3022 domain-containing protein [Burkholderia sp. R-70199]MBK5090012.1 DUF3022 domain-containing protein [Burkholderia sp. R-69927]MBK5124650.1 DUF3022 domain-containing protein [Burkholderia sp. R-69980]MBK5169064.1 DUF3022 domain-containing protein [Burkholderia sp. R-70211]MBK5182069.1 DUF3022 domain-containing protein [Burkholderia sp. R-6974